MGGRHAGILAAGAAYAGRGSCQTGPGTTCAGCRDDTPGPSKSLLRNGWKGTRTISTQPVRRRRARRHHRSKTPPGVADSRRQAIGRTLVRPPVRASVRDCPAFGSAASSLEFDARRSASVERQEGPRTLIRPEALRLSAGSCHRGPNAARSGQVWWRGVPPQGARSHGCGTVTRVRLPNDAIGSPPSLSLIHISEPTRPY